MKAIVQTHAMNLKESLGFYKSLDFQVISAKTPTIVTDGAVLIEINPSKTSRAGIKIIGSDLDKMLKKVSKIAPCFQKENGFITSSPEGAWVYFEKSMERCAFGFEKCSPSILGKFAGFTLEAVSIEYSLKFWKTLGFQVVAGSSEDGWVQLVGFSSFGIALMLPEKCPHSVANPSLTYFNGKGNREVIKEIRKLSIPIFEEVRFGNSKAVENLIIKDPGGLGFFLFND